MNIGGTAVDRQPNAMQNYLHNLIVRLSKPLRIRIGGNGMDGCFCFSFSSNSYLWHLIRQRSTYDPKQTTVIERTDPDAYFNDIPVNFGPAFFDILNGMYDKVGPMDFMIGLSMRYPEAWDDVVELALAAKEKLGDRLDAMLLGNVSSCKSSRADLWTSPQEPDLYAGHGERDAYEIKDYVCIRLPHCRPFL